MELHAGPKNYDDLRLMVGLRLRENQERGLGNGLNDKTKEGSTPIAVQKTILIYTYGTSCWSKKLC